MNRNELNIMIIAAHPDDAEARAGGFAALCRRHGHRVGMVSATNGCTGHYAMGGGELARRRQQEARASAQLIGAESLVLDVQSNELDGNLYLRKRLTEIIRAFRADLVLTHRPNDYHPDHRYTAILVQDTSATLCNPNVCPLTPPLKQAPSFLYMADNFTKPWPFTADLVFDIDSVLDMKIAMQAEHASQMFEWLPWESGTLAEVPTEPSARRTWLKAERSRRDKQAAISFREKLIAKYGPAAGAQIQYAEGFEFCEYGGGSLRKARDAQTGKTPWFNF